MIRIKEYLYFIKVPVVLGNLLVSIISWYVSASFFSWYALLFFAALFFIYSASAALNNYQDRKLDSLHRRTEGRSLPSGRLGSRDAIIFFLLLFVMAIFFFLFLNLLDEQKTQGNFLYIFFLVLLAIFFYNGVYTPLKKKSSFALLAGAFAGALPVLIGWSYGNAGIFHKGAFAIFFFLFVWQVPHTMMILYKYKEDYNQGKIPNLWLQFSNKNFFRILALWYFLMLWILLTFPALSLLQNPVSLISLYVFLIINFFYLIFLFIRPNFLFLYSKLLFVYHSFFLFFILSLLFYDKTLRHLA